MRCEATVCPYCRGESAAWTLHEDEWWSRIDGEWYWLDERENMWRTADEVYWEGSWWRTVNGLKYRQERNGTWVRAEQHW